jgi:hypothetical protein
MSEISHSVQIVKQAKNNLLTVQFVQLLTWQGRTLTWQVLSWQTVGIYEVKLFLDTWHIFDKWDGATWPRHGLPRGTIFNLVWLFKIIWIPWGSNPGLPAMVKRLHTVWVTNNPRVVSCYVYGFIYI